MARQGNIESEDGNNSEWLHEDASRSGPKLHPVWYSLKSVLDSSTCPCGCSFKHDQLCFPDDWGQRQRVSWGGLMETDRAPMVPHRYKWPQITKKPQLVNFNSPQTKNTPQLFLFPDLTDLKPTQTPDNHGCRPSNSLISDRVTTWVVGVWRCPVSDLLGYIRDTKTNSLPHKTYWRMKRCWPGGWGVGGTNSWNMIKEF